METKLENKSKQAASLWVPPFLSDEWWKQGNLRGCLVLKKPSLITHHSSLNFHQSSFKIPRFPKPHTFGTLFSASHHSNISTFCGTHTWHTAWAPYLRIHPFFFSHHSSPIPKHTVLSSSPLPFSSSHQVQTAPISTSSSTNNADLLQRKSTQCRSPPHPVPISTSPSADLHQHPACKITSDEQQWHQSPPSWLMSFLLRPPLFCYYGFIHLSGLS